MTNTHFELFLLFVKTKRFGMDMLPSSAETIKICLLYSYIELASSGVVLSDVDESEIHVS